MQSIIQKKSLILSIIFFVFSCLIFIFLYRDINKRKEVTQLAQEKWQIEATKRENTKYLIDSIKAIEDKRTLLETHFIKSSDIVPFLDTIEKLASEVGAKAGVSSVDIGKESNFLMVEMKATGSFETIYKLITLLENSQYEIDFTSADIENSGIFVNKIPQWTAVFQIKLLSFINK